MRSCPGCGHQFFSPHTLFRLPVDLDPLASALELPAETVTQMIATSAIPVRRAVDRNGRLYGPLLVLLADAAAAMRGSRTDIQ